MNAGFVIVNVLLAIAFMSGGLIGCRGNNSQAPDSISGAEFVSMTLMNLDSLDRGSPPSIRTFEDALVGFFKSPAATAKLVNHFETADGYMIIVDPDLSGFTDNIQKLLDGRTDYDPIPFDQANRIKSCVFRDPNGFSIAERSWE